MSSEASRWVTKRCRDVRPSVRVTLAAMATWADRHGCGIAVSKATLCDATGKSVRQIRRDLVELRKDGWIRPSLDQSLSLRYGGGRRPIVHEISAMADATEEEIYVVVHGRLPSVDNRDTYDHRGGSWTTPQRGHP